MTEPFREIQPPQGVEGVWEDWHWQLKNAIRNATELAPELITGQFTCSPDVLPLFITPYYQEIVRQYHDAKALARTVVPSHEETAVHAEELVDPLGEEKHQVADCVIHTYPDKVLFLATDHCAVHCRYCTRSRWIGAGTCSTESWQEGLEYIRRTPAVRDVLISGGDPLLLGNERLEQLLRALRQIDHVEIVRIGSKVPAVLPQRITGELAALLRKYNVWLVLHFTHPAELTQCCAEACERLADHGVPLASQTVLLKNVNDSTEIMKALMEGLLRMRVRPYYLLQCDPVKGSSHFRVPVRRGQQIIRELHGRTTGLAIPTYMVDAPGGGGKVPVGPDYIEEYDGTHWTLQDCSGGTARYFDPGSGD